MIFTLIFFGSLLLGAALSYAITRGDMPVRVVTDTPRPASPPRPLTGASNLNFINNSSDSNNSSVVIFQEPEPLGPEIKLTFSNQSKDGNSDIVIFQKNEASGFPELVVAWLVIKGCGPGKGYPFTYPMETDLCARDSWTSLTPQQQARPGQAFTVTTMHPGIVLQPAGRASNATTIEVTNGLPHCTIDTQLYKGDKLLGMQTGIAPGQKSSFLFTPTLFIGTATGVGQGEVIDAATLPSFNTQVSLLGISSADIVMSGGGSGPSAQPILFTLQNVVMA